MTRLQPISVTMDSKRYVNHDGLFAAAVVVVVFFCRFNLVMICKYTLDMYICTSQQWYQCSFTYTTISVLWILCNDCFSVCSFFARKIHSFFHYSLFVIFNVTYHNCREGWVDTKFAQQQQQIHTHANWYTAKRLTKLLFIVAC